MNPGDVVDKTEKGVREIQTRALGLPPRLRTLLIMADGRHTVAQLQQSAAQVGAPADSLQTLLQQELVALRALERPRPAEPPRPPEPVAPRAAAPVTVATAPAATAVQRVLAAQKLMNDTAVDAVGMKSFFFTWKVEQSLSQQDLLQLLPEYLRLIAKAKGADVARRLEEQLRELLS